MIESTFIHATGIGPATEQSLWEAGAHTWTGYLDQHADGEWKGARFDSLAKTVEQSGSALRRRDVTFFSQRLAAGDQWRLYPTFQDRVAYVDIETTGLSPNFSEITVVALFDGTTTKTFVRGKDLHRFPAEISRYSMLVTFNGSTFDVPFLRAEFPKIRIPSAHLDLRFALGRLGYSGGLKAIEKAIGIKRPAHLREVDGFEAVRLWRQYERGNKTALKTLVDYAAEDVKSLAPLATRACSGLANSVGLPVA
jgi:uncharacterized protein YprB with RNaseH-like and TPR domain